jgi:hypothetical protein
MLLSVYIISQKLNLIDHIDVLLVYIFFNCRRYARQQWDTRDEFVNLEKILDQSFERWSKE